MKTNAWPRLRTGAFAVVVIATIFLAGCLQSENDPLGTNEALAASLGGEGWIEAWGPTNGRSLPSIDELNAALDLTDQQAEALSNALDELEDDLQGSRRSGRPGRGGMRGPRGPGGPRHGMPGGFARGEAPFLTFVESAFEILDQNQIVPFAEFMKESRGERAAKFGAGRGGVFSGRVLKRVAAELDLSAEQVAAARDALEASGESFRELRVAYMAGEISAEELRDASRDLRSELESSLQEILSSEQYTRLQEIHAEHRARVASKMLERLSKSVDRRVTFLADVLDLTDPQVSQAMQILESFVPRRTELLEQIRDGLIEVEDALYGGYQIAEDTAEALRAILTEGQVVRFEAIRILLPGHGKMR